MKKTPLVGFPLDTPGWQFVCIFYPPPPHLETT